MSQSYLKKKDYQAYLVIVVVVLSIFTFNTLNNSRWDLNTPLHNIDIKFLGSERAEKNHAIAVLVLGVCLEKLMQQTDLKYINFEFRKDYWPDSTIEVRSKEDSRSIKLTLSFAYKELRWKSTENQMMHGDLEGTRSPWELTQANENDYNIHAYGAALPLYLKMKDGTIKGKIQRSPDFDYQINGSYSPRELSIKITRSYDTFEIFGSLKNEGT